MLLLLFDLGLEFHDYSFKGGNLCDDRLSTFLLSLRQLAFLVKDEPGNCPASRSSASSDHLCVLNRVKDVFNNSNLPTGLDLSDAGCLTLDSLLAKLLKLFSFKGIGQLRTHRYEMTDIDTYGNKPLPAIFGSLIVLGRIREILMMPFDFEQRYEICGSDSFEMTSVRYFNLRIL